MKLRGEWLVLLLSVTGGLAGCGGTAPSTGVTPMRAAASNLAGNWLLAGSLPAGPDEAFKGTEVAVTFATVGDQLVGTGQARVACPAAPTGSILLLGPTEVTFVVTGQILADGSFVTQSQGTTANGIALPLVKISGQLPATAGGTWAGSYEVDTTQTQSSCPVKVGDAVQASTIAPLTGVYQATGAIVNGAGKTPITVTMMLQQGVTSSAGGVFADQAYALNGSVTVDGTTCFHTGTLRTAVPTAAGLAGVGGAVFGSMAFPFFTMDDGSSLIANVYVNDVAASQLSSEGLGVSSGNCASSLTQQIQIGNFVRR